MAHRPASLCVAALLLVLASSAVFASSAALADQPPELFTASGLAADLEAELPLRLPDPLTEQPWRPVHVDLEALGAARAGQVLELELLGGERITVRTRRTIDNPSGSVSLVADVEGDPRGLVVLVHKRGVAVGSIRRGGELFMLAHAGPFAGDPSLHVLHRALEDDPRRVEMEPTPATPGAAKRAAAEDWLVRAAAGEVAQDDGSIHDLLVVYTPRAKDEVGGVVAIENLIDLGVTETNLSYETSGISHRLRLVHTAETDYDESSGLGDPRDLLQNQTDGVMDEVHGVRDLYGADLVMLVVANGGGCGRAFIMNEVSVAFEEFAFCYTNHICISPGYTFQHELGHVQSARHQRFGPGQEEGSPFAFNHGYFDADNEFRTIMAAGDQDCPDGCPRQLAWSNPEVTEPMSGAPMGVPEGDPFAADNRKTLNATGFVVANFRLAVGVVFADGFESGDVGAWSETSP